MFPDYSYIPCITGNCQWLLQTYYWYTSMIYFENKLQFYIVSVFYCAIPLPPHKKAIVDPWRKCILYCQTLFTICCQMQWIFTGKWPQIMSNAQHNCATPTSAKRQDSLPKVWSISWWYREECRHFNLHPYVSWNMEMAHYPTDLFLKWFRLWIYDANKHRVMH